MKILNWIDQFVDSFEKRVFLFTFFVGLYCLWQAIWQVWLYFNLIPLSDYSSLFTLYSNLDRYSSSLLVRIIYQIISSSNHFLSCFDFVDILGCVGFLLMVKEYKVSVVLLALKYIWILVLLCIGISANSLNMVIFALKLLGIGSLILEIGFIMSILYKLASMILDVHNS